MKRRSITTLVLALGSMMAQGVATAQRLLTVPDLTVLEPRGDVLQVTQVVPTLDGGHVVAGRFSYWFEGKRRFDLLKLKADGNPDLSWSPELSFANLFANGPVTRVSPTPLGVFVMGDFQAVNGVAVGEATIIDWAKSQALPWPVILPRYATLAISSYDSAADWVYFGHALNGHYRISGRTGQLDATWFSPAVGGCKKVDPGALELHADGRGRLWLREFFAPVALGDTGTDSASWCELQASTSVGHKYVIGETVSASAPSRFFAVAGDYVYLHRRRYARADFAEDTAWTRPNTHHVSDRFAYAITEPSSRSAAVTVSRHVVGDGAEDIAARYDMPINLTPYRWSVYTHWWAPSGLAAESAGVLVMDRATSDSVAAQNVPALRGFVVKDHGKADPEVTVVEYYVPALKHYFLTGRANEQAALDALPQSFVRTGMTFRAKSSKYRDTPEQPVCRMYASPENGLSNSHFYGVGDDCRTLNTLSGLRYEGYDFSVQPPLSTTTCPASAPTAVTRMFNNRASSNDGNHRYVVSAATKARMLAQDWVDEGAVFCTSAATDASN